MATIKELERHQAELKTVYDSLTRQIEITEVGLDVGMLAGMLRGRLSDLLIEMVRTETDIKRRRTGSNEEIISKFTHSFHAFIRKEIPAITSETRVEFTEQRHFRLSLPTPRDLYVTGEPKLVMDSTVIDVSLIGYKSDDGLWIYAQYVPQVDTLFAHNGMY